VNQQNSAACASFFGLSSSLFLFSNPRRYTVRDQASLSAEMSWIQGLRLATRVAPGAATFAASGSGFGARPAIRALNATQGFKQLHTTTWRAYPRSVNSSYSGSASGGGSDGNGKKPGSGEDEAEAEHEPESEKHENEVVEEQEEGSKQSSEVEHGSDGSTSTSSSSSSGSTSQTSSSPPPPHPGNSIARPSVPSTYPQVLCLPIARRPLFPGFYKAVVIKNPAVIDAIKDMIARGQPYLGAFLLKPREDGEEEDSDVLPGGKRESVFDVGVFAQVTSVFYGGQGPALAGQQQGEKKEGANGEEAGKDSGGGGGEPEGLTAVLYPHRRIKIDELVQGPDGLMRATISDTDLPLPTPPSTPISESPPSSVEPSSGSSGSSSGSMPPPPPHTHTSFLLTHPQISIVKISNLATEQFNKADPEIRALTTEIISVFKDIAQLNPLFRDQITNFSMNQVTPFPIFCMYCILSIRFLNGCGI
jgi:ATP-dependent Lon protease